MADEQKRVGGGFTIGTTSRRHTAEDLARLEEDLRRAQARLDELAADVTVAPAPRFDRRHRTLPEHMVGFELAHAGYVATLEEARSVLRACEIQLEEAQRGLLSDHAELEEQRRAAQARLTRAETRVEHSRLFNEQARAQLPEDDEAETQARIAHAELRVQLLQSAVADARADLLPDRCRDALEQLATHATDEWLYRHGPSDPNRRTLIRPQILMNIRLQLATTMFHPDLAELDLAINITADPEPRHDPDAQAPDSTDPAHQLANMLNRLRFGTGE